VSVRAPRDGREMTLEDIAQVMGTSKGVVNNLLRRALKKLRRASLICTARELSLELDRNRATEHTVRHGSRRRGGAE
jgi:hypothetical protein